jgi:hypothetical protein
MKLSDKWSVTSNDGDVVTLRRETDDTYEESTIQRPDNTDKKAWLDQWPVGLEIGNDAYHDRVRYESVRRKGAGVLTASEACTLARWNRPDHALKQVADVTESCRVFLKDFGTEDMVGYARLLYLKFSTRPGIAAEFAAITNEASLFAFIDRWEGIDDSPLDIAELERVQREGFWKGRQ